MAKERVLQHRNTGTADVPVWSAYYPITVADAVKMSDGDSETTNIKGYVDGKIDAIMGGEVPEALDTLKEVADAIAQNQGVVDGLNAAIGNKADKTHTHAVSDVTALQTNLDSKTDKAFSAVKVGADIAQADSRAAQLEFVAGSGVDLQKDAASNKITITATGEAVSDEAMTAQRLKTPRTIGMSGAVTASGTAFDGSENITINAAALDATTLSGKVPAASLNDATTAAKGVVQLSSATNSTAESTAATPKAVKDAYDRANTGVSDAATAQSKADSAYTLADSKSSVMFAESLPSNAPVGAICFLIS